MGSGPGTWTADGERDRVADSDAEGTTRFGGVNTWGELDPPMPILRKLKSLLGADEDGDEAERDVTVTVEHDPENEAAVKGADVEESATAGGSHAVAVSDAEESAEDTADEPATTDDEEDEEQVEADTAADAEASEGTATDEESTPDEGEIQDAEEPDASGASGSDEPVDELNGVGPAYAQRLGDAGIESVGELADADAGELSEATEIAEGRIQGWIDQAGEY